MWHLLFITSTIEKILEMVRDVFNLFNKILVEYNNVGSNKDQERMGYFTSTSYRNNVWDNLSSHTHYCKNVIRGMLVCWFSITINLRYYIERFVACICLKGVWSSNSIVIAIEIVLHILNQIHAWHKKNSGRNCFKYLNCYYVNERRKYMSDT